MSHRAKRDLIAIALTSMSPALCWGAAEGGESVNIFAGDIGNVLWTLVIFGGVLFVLGKYAWGPILSNLQQREEFIRDSLEKAKQDRDAAEARLKEYEERLNTARAEATAIVDEGRRDAEVVRERIEKEAQAEAERMLQRAKREIVIAKETAVKEIYTVSGGLAIDIASRIVARELTAQDHQRLIEDSITEMNQMASIGGQNADA